MPFLLMLLFSLTVTTANSETYKPKVHSFSNKWIHAEIGAPDGLSVSQFYAHQEPVLWIQDKAKSLPSSLFLYTNHPLKSSKTIAMPESYVADYALKSPSETVIQVKSVTATLVSISRDYRINHLESTLKSTTTITNNSKKSIEFYPTEEITFKAAIRNNIPNTAMYFYSPSAGNKKGFDLIKGETNSSLYSYMPEHNLFLTRYMLNNAVIKLTNNKNWFAIQNLISKKKINGGTVCAVEFEFPEKDISPVKDNLILHINGVDDLATQNSKSSAFNPYMQATYVLGKVVLQPGRSLTYSTRWNSVVCDGPIVDVKDSIVFNKRLEVQFHPGNGGFANFANFGVPQEGRIGFQYYNQKGEVKKTITENGDQKDHLMIIHIKSKIRPFEVTPFLPTLLTHMAWVLSPEDFHDEINTYQKLVDDEVHSIRMVLVDSNWKPLRELDRFTAPYKIFGSTAAE